MYKRTAKALIKSPPPVSVMDEGGGVVMFDTQHGRAKYSSIAFTIARRTDQDGAVGIIVKHESKNISIPKRS